MTVRSTPSTSAAVGGAGRVMLMTGILPVAAV